MSLTDLIPTADVLLALQPEELAGYVLEYIHSKGDPKKYSEAQANFASEHVVRGYSPEKQMECQKALMEAWACLKQDGLIAPEPRNMLTVYFLTRRGQSIKTRKDYQVFRHANLFPKESVHPVLREKVYPQFLREDYETAVFQSFKIVEVAVRDAAGTDYTTMYGTPLMRHAFHPETGPLSDKSEPYAEREALQALFAGAIGRFKNPTSHRHVPITNPNEAIEMILLASHLLRIVDERKK